MPDATECRGASTGRADCAAGVYAGRGCRVDRHEHADSVAPLYGGAGPSDQGVFASEATGRAGRLLNVKPCVIAMYGLTISKNASYVSAKNCQLIPYSLIFWT